MTAQSPLFSSCFLKKSLVSVCTLKYSLFLPLLVSLIFSAVPDCFTESSMNADCFFHTHMRTLATQIKKKKKSRNRKCVVGCSHPPYTRLLCSLKKKHGRRRGKWEDELGPLFVSPNASGFLCRVIYLNMVDGVLISGH